MFIGFDKIKAQYVESTYEGEERLEKDKGDDYTHKEWAIEKVYPYSTKRHTQNSILGFAVKDNSAVAVTRDSLICFKHNKKICWEKSFRYNGKIVFASIPKIYNDKIFNSIFIDFAKFIIWTGYIF